ncbi:MAG: hypothetical protein CMK59_14200 [Proteobacteria bacterium]|nr:hypothetical protein [Pseudomonadota bacterium]
MNASEATLLDFLKTTSYALKSDGTIQAFGPSKHIPHIRIQLFLALMRLGKLKHLAHIPLQPYLFALLMLHKKWLVTLRHQFFPKPLKISDFKSKYELSLYIKMGGGSHWEFLQDSDLMRLPYDLSTLTSVHSCIISRNCHKASKKISTLPNLNHLSFHCSKICIDFCSLEKEKNTEAIQILDVSFSDITPSVLESILQLCPDIHTLYICGTPHLKALPKLVQERNIKIYAFASACCTPDTNQDFKVRTLLFSRDEGNQHQGLNLLKSLADNQSHATVRIEDQSDPYHSRHLYEGFTHCKFIFATREFSYSLEYLFFDLDLNWPTTLRRMRSIVKNLLSTNQDF